ncbi:hypothetical protein F4823DRAFT_488380 [Ustulina deusta]|nr:hypothetical protein F4823DRAFT_488380 [Ustulina deusta]
MVLGYGHVGHQTRGSKDSIKIRVDRRHGAFGGWGASPISSPIQRRGKLLPVRHCLTTFPNSYPAAVKIVGKGPLITHAYPVNCDDRMSLCAEQAAVVRCFLGGAVLYWPFRTDDADLRERHLDPCLLLTLYGLYRYCTVPMAHYHDRASDSDHNEGFSLVIRSPFAKDTCNLDVTKCMHLRGKIDEDRGPGLYHDKSNSVKRKSEAAVKLV